MPPLDIILSNITLKVSLFPPRDVLQNSRWTLQYVVKHIDVCRVGCRIISRTRVC